jgi:hypothetical protein
VRDNARFYPLRKPGANGCAFVLFAGKLADDRLWPVEDRDGVATLFDVAV